jgi:hypothetical protein
MTVRTYYATDAEAPILNGNLGSLKAVLLECLVNGYGSKDPAGWTLEFDDTNRMVLKQGAGNQRYFRFNDNLTLIPRQATVACYETMSDVDTGTNRIPSGVEEGLYIDKSESSNSASPRDWMLFATESAVWLVTNTSSTGAFGSNHITFFGDFPSFKQGDLWNTSIIGKETSGATDVFDDTSLIATTCTGHFVFKSYTELGSCIKLGKHWDSNKSTCQFPNPVDGSLLYSKLWLTEPNVVRGHLPGIRHILHPVASFNQGDTFEGEVDDVNRTFQIIKTTSYAYAIEISDTW